jgi:hypothetical protein
MNAMPPHRLSSLRRLRFYMFLNQHPALNTRTRSDWDDIWAFFAEAFDGLTVLRVDLGMSLALARCVCGEAENEGEWLLPVVQSIDGARCGEESRSSSSIEPRTLFVSIPGLQKGHELVNMNEARAQAKKGLEPGHTDTELDVITCRCMHKRMQSSIRGWLDAVQGWKRTEG